MKKLHEIEKINFEDDYLTLSVDNKVYRFPLEVISGRLLEATERERQIYQISPSGYGIHWLMIDEDLSIDGLLKLAEVNHYELSRS